MAFYDNISDKDAFVTLYELWGRKNPSYEKHYEDEVIKKLADFGRGTNEVSDAKGKVLGAGYEALIMAFFIGLYANKKRPLDEDEPLKDLRQPLQFWGNVDSKKGRKAYPRLREYIFMALVARTPDIDWFEVDKGRWTLSEAVSLLMMTMEQYINYGLSIMKDKMDEDENYFVNPDSFLTIFKNLTAPTDEEIESDEPESLSL